MFHCNGWCHPWAVTAAGGQQVCLRAVDGAASGSSSTLEGVTHLCGAPAVLSVLVNDPAAEPVERPLTVTVAARPARPTILAQTEALGATSSTSTGSPRRTGPTPCASGRSDWEDEDAGARARLLSRQGVAM